MVSVLRSTCADGKMQKDGELCEGTGTSEKKGINIKSYSQGGVALELGSGDVALGRWEGRRRAFEEPNSVSTGVGIRLTWRD